MRQAETVLAPKTPLFNVYAPGQPHHGDTITQRAGESVEEAVERTRKKWAGEICPNCENSLRINGIFAICAAGCGFRRPYKQQVF